MDARTKRGQILKELRIKKGLKQSELAELLNISQQAYQRYEAGTSEPNADGFTILANFYGVTIDYLLDREVDADTYTRQIESLSPEHQKIAIAFLHMLHDVDEEKDKKWGGGITNEDYWILFWIFCEKWWKNFQ